MSQELKLNLSFTGQFKNKRLGSKWPTKRFWLEINGLMTRKAAVADDASYMYVILVNTWIPPPERERGRALRVPSCQYYLKSPSLIAHVNNIPTMQFWIGIPRHTQSTPCYAIIDWVCLGISEWCILGYSLTCPISSPEPAFIIPAPIAAIPSEC